MTTPHNTDKKFIVKPTTLSMRFASPVPPLKDFSIYNEATKTIIASLDKEVLSERLCSLLNDIPFSSIDNHDHMQDRDNKRLCETMQLFLMQENLTWYDLGFADEHIRLVNKYLEMKINLQQE